MVYNILFCGTGGQGVLKASEICGIAALEEGFRIKKSEVHGMAQRGGSVESHLRFGDRIYSPLISPGGADYLVCFHREEARRVSLFLKPKGVNFLPFIDLFEKSAFGVRFLNTFFLGILSAYLPIEQRHWLSSLEKVFARNREENRRIFLEGAREGRTAPVYSGE
jgi:indolepyruvate ferredoxin oxidoreductase beta subunit